MINLLQEAVKKLEQDLHAPRTARMDFVDALMHALGNPTQDALGSLSEFAREYSWRLETEIAAMARFSETINKLAA